MSNWKNVNNWHWTSKNCTKWANEYLSAELKQISVEKDGIAVKVDDLKEFSGDVDLSQRKGKVITIYDVKLEISWSGERARVAAVSERRTTQAHAVALDRYGNR
jgi:activator of HSP90 ATPase